MSFVHDPDREAGRLQRWSLYLFARYLEMPLLKASYHLLRGRYRRVGAIRPVRALLTALAAPFGYAGDTARPLPTSFVINMIDALDGAIAVGPCRCRSAHHACDHPLETDLVIRAGVGAWTRAFPRDYRVISKGEAQDIVYTCSQLDMWHMVFVHCPIGEHGQAPHDHAGHFHLGHEYVICNCCTCGCVPYLLNRELGQRAYPLLLGQYVAWTYIDRCMGDGACVDVCPFGARAVIDGCAALVNPCYGCGLCVAACPHGAIHMGPRGH